MQSAERRIGIFTVDTQLRVVSWDDWLARITGVSTQAAHGRLLADLFPELERRGLLERLSRVLSEGVVEVLAPALHHYLLRCAPEAPSANFDSMQQYVTLAPLRDDRQVVGALVTVEDVTARLDRERELEEALTHPDEAVRLSAAEALAAEEGEARRLLASSLGDSSWRVRRVAAGGYARHGGDEAVATLLRALREEHHSPSVLSSALHALTLIGTDTLPPLAECLRSPDTDLRVYAALALGERRDARAVPALRQALSDPEPNVRYHAIEALGKLRAGDAAGDLLAIAESRDFFLAFPALDALVAIARPHAGALSMPAPDVQALLAELRAAPRLIPLLSDRMLRGPAAQALGQVGDVDAARPLAVLLNASGAPATLVAQALTNLYLRYEQAYGEGQYLADVVRGAIDQGGVAGLLAALQDANPEELQALARVLGWLEGPDVERALAQLLGRPSVRRDVVEALVRYGPRVSELLVEQLDAVDVETARAAALALGRVGGPDVVPALLHLLDGESELAVAAASALARIGDRRAFEPLLALIGHNDATVRQAAVAALNSLGHPDLPARVCELLGSGDPYIRESAVKIAGYFGYPQCADQLLACCRDGDERVRRAAVEHLPYLEDARALPVLVHALQADTARVRAAAARTLGQMDEQAALPYLIDALEDPDAWVRYYAARATCHHNDARAVDRLARLAREDTASQVRIAAIEALAGCQADGRVIGVLVPLAREDDLDLARAALEALGRVAHPQALPPLLHALRSADPARRSVAARALGERGGLEAVEALREAATETHAGVAQAAIAALARVQAPPEAAQAAVQALIERAADPAGYDACVAALSELDEGRIVWMVEGLRHTNPEHRHVVVEALARMKRPAASAALAQALDDADASVRLAAVRLLGQLGSQGAEWKLKALARSDPDVAVRAAAQSALLAHGGQGAERDG